MIRRVALVLAAALTTPGLPALADKAALESNFREKDQALLDAIAPGNKALWDATLTADAVYIDENGIIMDRAEFLNALAPLPPGASGQLKIVDYRLSDHGDTAIVIHRDDESEIFHGMTLGAAYLTSEVWRREGGTWKLALAHVYVVAKDPPPVAAELHTLQAYAGRYRAGTDYVYVISIENGQLAGGAEGGKKRPLKLEHADTLFIPGQPRVRLLFTRDSTGHVAGFINRREGEDMVFARIGPG